MALTRSFTDTVRERAQKNAGFRMLLLQEAMESLLNGSIEQSKLILRGYINATIGFEMLAQEINKSPKSLMRMLGPKGNPTMSNIAEIFETLKKRERVHFKVKAISNPRRSPRT